MYTYSLVQWFLFFYIYCFLGWVWESCFVSFKKKRWVNRGFMHGPFLPIYGSGAIMVLFATLPVKDNLFLVFILGMIGATLLEYVTGDAMERLFHVRYWDYSSKPFNINGHVCLLCSLAWGVFSVLMETVFHQPIENMVFALPHNMVELVTLGLTIGIAIDMTESFNEAMDLREILVNMTENNEEIQRLRKRLDAVVTVLDEQTKDLKVKAEESRQVLAYKFKEEKRKYGSKVKEQLDKTTQLKLSTQKRLEINLEKGREKQAALLSSLSDRINTYSEIAGTYLKDQEGSFSEDVEAMLNELKGIKQSIIRQQKKLASISNSQAFKSMKMLGRNPGAVSVKYTEALKKLQELVDKKMDRKN